MNRVILAAVAALTVLSTPGHASAPDASTSCASPAGKSPPIVCSGCDVAGAKQRRRSSTAAVFTAPDGKGRSLFGCPLGEGKPRRLGSPGAYGDRWGDHQDSWRLVRLRGHFVAFERHYFGCPSFHCRKSELGVYDLRTGRRTLRWIDDPGEPYYVGSSDLVVASEGSIAWISLRDRRLWLARAARPRQSKRLDTHVDPHSLSLRDGVLSWSRDGRRSQCALKRRERRAAGC
jgi:hypothetical protein